MLKINHRNILNFALNKISKSTNIFSLQSRYFTLAKPVFSHEFKSHRTGN